MQDNDDYLQLIGEISESEAYKALVEEYYGSLDKMETSMNDIQFQMVLNHERVLRKFKAHIAHEMLSGCKKEIHSCTMLECGLKMA